ncbi:calnexin-like isoform X2 [Toxorhynchites rutilus septentrionalis]|uniref:calnexin-like isoform X2 n=1 Tax=Toxorhynchites rutilus septentrionalis TaxID=329112 RepID=UPI00247997B4|nr:calnexin-like isoform X2 [Toxorhynchites rutilus septentrionalis]
MEKLKIMLLLSSIVLLAKPICSENEIPTETSEQDTENNAIYDLFYESPNADPKLFHFADHFDDKDQFATQWIISQAKKDDTAEEIAKYDGEWSLELPKRPLLPNDLGLVLKSKAKHAAIAAHLNRKFVFTDKPLVVQYEVNLQDGQECGGSYIKLLSAGKETTDLRQFHDKTPYTIMFGPDKCGNDIKLHFIFRHVNPINGSITEKHCRKAKDRLDEPFKDKQPHLYQLVVKPDNTYIIRFDHKIINEGSLFTEFTPPVIPPKEIDDPEDAKPENWDEREKIPDPEATKPDDWDENEPPQIPDPSASKPEGWLSDVEEMIPDPNAEKPADWDIEMDGDWEAPLIANPLCEKAVGCGFWKAPMISNPNYKGKWRSPLIDNPNYQGKWAPRKIPNPDFFEDANPFKMTPIAAIGIELWSMSSDILFDNLIITDDEAVARDWAAQTFDLKQRLIDREAETFVSRMMKFANENPWMWAVLVVVIGLPLAIILYLVCTSKASPSPSGKTKKTDECTPDSEPREEDTLHSKSNLNSPDENGDTLADKATEEVENKNSDEDENVDEDDDFDAEDATDEHRVETTSQVPVELDSGTRKRKQRRE